MKFYSELCNRHTVLVTFLKVVYLEILFLKNYRGPPTDVDSKNYARFKYAIKSKTNCSASNLFQFRFIYQNFSIF